MTSRLLIIGKNSRLYKTFSHDFDSNFSVTAISHREAEEFDWSRPYDMVLVLSTTHKISDMRDLFLLIKKSCKCRVILMSSIVVELPRVFNFYRYVAIKKTLEALFLSIMPTQSIVRSGAVFSNSQHAVGTRIGDLLVSIAKSADSAEQMITSKLVVDRSWCPGMIYKSLFAMKLYPICRAFDFFYAKAGRTNYGYTYALYLLLVKRSP
jgi:hypothetical protein